MTQRIRSIELHVPHEAGRVAARLEPSQQWKVSQKVTEGRNFFPPNPASGKPLGLTIGRNGLQTRFRTETSPETDTIYRKD
jgi:hypothetical protein